MDLKQFGSRHWLSLTVVTTLALLFLWNSRPLPQYQPQGESDLLSDELGGQTPLEKDQPQAPGPIAGSWVGQLEEGNRKTEYRFTLEEVDGSLSGTVRSPAGEGVVEAGSLLNGNVTLVTLYGSGSQQRQTQFVGTHAGDRLYLVMKTDGGDVNLTLQRQP